MGAISKSECCKALVAATPQQIRLNTFWPVSGLVRCWDNSCIPFPEQVFQWFHDAVSRTYRCGGSTGFASSEGQGAPVSRLTQG